MRGWNNRSARGLRKRRWKGYPQPWCRNWRSGRWSALSRRNKRRRNRSPNPWCRGWSALPTMRRYRRKSWRKRRGWEGCP